MAEFYRLPLVASIPDQDLLVNIISMTCNIRVFYSTCSQVWWLELSSADNSVTLSQIALRPDVMHRIEGKISGYTGSAAIGMCTNRPGGLYSSIDAFAGDFYLYFSDENEGD